MKNLPLCYFLASVIEIERSPALAEIMKAFPGSEIKEIRIGNRDDAQCRPGDDFDTSGRRCPMFDVTGCDSSRCYSRS